MKKSKKSQFLILSAVFLILLLIIIYSQETENSYIIKTSKIGILNNIVYETCMVGKMSNGSYIDLRFVEFTTNVDNYCVSLGDICTLNILKSTSAPTNLSLLNYSFYNFSINYYNDGFNYSSNFTC